MTGHGNSRFRRVTSAGLVMAAWGGKLFGGLGQALYFETGETFGRFGDGSSIILSRDASTVIYVQKDGRIGHYNPVSLYDQPSSICHPVCSAVGVSSRDSAVEFSEFSWYWTACSVLEGD
eukprot:1389557-Amorphochlora_amoeboformis.AAC.1